MKLKLILPVRIQTSANKKFSLNLNTYRNAHHHTKNTAKKNFAADLYTRNSQVLNEVIKAGNEFAYPLHLQYKLFTKTKRKCDIANVLSIVDKFACDALVDLGLIVDDNYDYISKIEYLWGEVDKDNPRVELIIKELK